MQKDTSAKTSKKTKNYVENYDNLSKLEKKMLELAERLKKKDTPGNSYKSTIKNISFFHSEQVFVATRIIKISNTTNYHD